MKHFLFQLAVIILLCGCGNSPESESTIDARIVDGKILVTGVNAGRSELVFPSELINSPHTSAFSLFVRVYDVAGKPLKKCGRMEADFSQLTYYRASPGRRFSAKIDPRYVSEAYCASEFYVEVIEGNMLRDGGYRVIAKSDQVRIRARR